MKHQSIVYLLTLFFLFSCQNEEINSNCLIEKTTDVYNYPIKPGTSEWAQFSNGQEMLNACQLPEKLLNTISTDGLIETVLNFPLFGDIYLSNFYQEGFDYYAANFNGMKELLNRQDAAEKLFKRYKKMAPSCNKNNWPSLGEAGSDNNYSFSFIEIIIAQYVILNQFIKNDKLKTLLQETISKYQEKRDSNYSVIGLQHSVLISGRIMYLSNFSPFIDEYNNNVKVKSFIDGATIRETETLKIINDYAQSFFDTL